MEPICHDRIFTEAEFLDLAKRLGDPIRLENGSYIGELRVTGTSAARKNSLSGKFGTGSFPFHTDTAFWNLPARLVLLRAIHGDFSRPTLVSSFSKILEGISPSVVRQGAWLCDTGPRKWLTTMAFKRGDMLGYRYDPNCMTPANRAAEQVDKVVRPLCFSSEGMTINWKEGRVLVIPNWTHLHARGESFSPNQTRLIERIYIY